MRSVLVAVVTVGVAVGVVVAASMTVGACSRDLAADGPDTTTSSTATPTTSTTTSTTTTPITTPSTPITTTPITTTPVTTTPITTTPTEIEPASYPVLTAAVFDLGRSNAGFSVSVRRVGADSWGLAAGVRNDGRPITTDTPFVIASVSKLVTAVSVARLVEAGLVEVGDPVPWDDLGIVHDPAWDDVTIRELLDHTSGMPVNSASWLDDPGTCAIPLGEAMASPPTATRGTWRYSNGNYCALGLAVEHLWNAELDVAVDDLVFDPAGISGPFLSSDGEQPTAAPYGKGLVRLSRLGGAGMWLASTDDLAGMLASVTAADLTTLRWPGIIVDQYGWGHTGTLDGAKACAWVLEDGRTVVAAVVSGQRPATGGDLCDRVVTALAADLGIAGGEPIRSPI